MKLKSELARLPENADDSSRNILLQAMQMNMLRLKSRLSEFKVINKEYLHVVAPHQSSRARNQAIQNSPPVDFAKNVHKNQMVFDRPSRPNITKTVISPMPLLSNVIPVTSNREAKSIHRSTQSKKDLGINSEQKPPDKKTPEKIVEVSRPNASHLRCQESNQVQSRNRMMLIPSSNVESFDSELHDTERIHQSIIERSSPKSQRTIHESQIVKNGKSGFQMSNKPRKTPRSNSPKRPPPIEVLGSQFETSNEPASKNSLPVISSLKHPVIIDLSIPPAALPSPKQELDDMANRSKNILKTIIESYLANKQIIAQIITILSGKVPFDIDLKTNEELVDIIFSNIESHKEKGFLSLIFSIQGVEDHSLKALAITAECSSDPYFQMAVVQHLLKNKRKMIKGEMLVILLRMVTKITATRRLKLVIAKYLNYLE